LTRAALRRRTFRVVLAAASFAARLPHNPPMQRTGAAGIVSFFRKLLGRGSGH